MGDNNSSFKTSGFNFELINSIQQNVNLIRSFSPINEHDNKSFELFSPITKNVQDITGAFHSVTLNVNQFMNMDLLTNRFNEACERNTKYGWCMSAHMTIGEYKSIAKEEDSQVTKDRLFVRAFESDNYDLYKRETDYITTTAQEDWQDFYEECFYSINNGKYKAVVPSLVSAIEHELSYEQSDEIGKRLIRRVQSSLVQTGDTSSIIYAISASVLNLLRNIVFGYRGFTEDRMPLINRNWVLHGRDNPTLWNKKDVYRLITMISALRMLNEWNSLVWSQQPEDDPSSVIFD